MPRPLSPVLYPTDARGPKWTTPSQPEAALRFHPANFRHRWDTSHHRTRKKLVQTVGNAEMTQWPLRLDDLSIRNIWVQGSIHLPHRFRAHMMTPTLQQSTFSVYLAETWHNGLGIIKTWKSGWSKTIAFGQQIGKNKAKKCMYPDQVTLLTYPVRTHAPWNLSAVTYYFPAPMLWLKCVASNVSYHMSKM